MRHSAARREKNRRPERLSGSLLSLALVRLRRDGKATFHSPQGVTYEQLGKGNNEFVDLEEALSLYPTPAQIPECLLPSREVLDTLKNSKGEVVRCPFCPSTFSGTVARKSFKRHLQRHWNHAAAQEEIEIDHSQSSLYASLIPPIAHPVPDAKELSNTQDQATSYPSAQQPSHDFLASTSTPLLTSTDATDHAPASGPLTLAKRPLTTSVHAGPKAPKPGTSKQGRKSIATSTLGTVCKDNTTLAIARTMEVLRSKSGIVFYHPDAHPNLHHQSFTQREEQFLDVDATFSVYPTIGKLPESFWPTSPQYTAAAPGQHRIRCLFCSWSFSGVYVKANFRGHVRYHWKLAAAWQQANSSAPANVGLSPATQPSPHGPSASSLGPTKLMESGSLLQPNVVDQPSTPTKIRSTQFNQVAIPGSPVTKPAARRPQGRKRKHTEAFVEDKTGSESALAKSMEKHVKSLYYPVLLSIARSLATIRMKPGTILIPPEQSMSYEELVPIADCYFDIDKVVAVYPFLDELPVRFWPSDETFEKVGTKGGSEGVRCPFCIVTLKGSSAKESLKIHLQCHWWYSSEQNDSETCAGVLTGSIESVDSSYARSSLNCAAIPLPPSVPSVMQPNTYLEKAQLSMIRTHADPEMTRGDSHSKEPRLQSTHPLSKVQRAPRYVWTRLLQSIQY